MKTIIYILFLFSPILLYAQSKSAIGVFGGMGYAHRTLNSETETSSFKLRQNRETGTWSYGFGVSYNQHITGRFFFKTGLNLSLLGYKYNVNQPVIWGTEINPTTGEVTDIVGSPNFFKYITEKFLFVAIPLVVRYELNDQKFTPYLEGGFAPALYLNSYSEIAFDDKVEKTWTKNNAYKEYHLFAHFALGLNYKLTAKNVLFLQPTISYQLNQPSEGNAPIREHLYNISLETGVRFAIK